MAAAQPSALATYLFIDTLLLGQSSSRCSPGMPAARMCAVLGRQWATCSHCLADAPRLSAFELRGEADAFKLSV